MTPRYDAQSGRVEISIEADLSELTDPASPGGPPGRRRTQLESVANMEPGQALVMSGVESRSEQEVQGGLPGLSQIPIVGVLGNHDFESGHLKEVAQILRDGGMTLLNEQAVEIAGVGFAGVKGFIGGFGRGELGSFGEPAIKAFVEEGLNEARKLENQLRTLRTERAVVVLHYSPIADTVEGEPLEIYPFLGSSRLAEPIDRFENVRLVVHGHAHRGAYEGRTMRGVPVYNCSIPVLQALFGRPYALLEV